MTIEIDPHSLDQSALGRLTEFLRKQYPELEDLKLTEWSELSGGWETDLYRIKLDGTRYEQPAIEELVVRLYKGADPLQKAKKEFSLLTGVPRFGISTPRVDALVTDPAILGNPFLIMEYLDGGSLDERIERNEIANWMDPMTDTLAQIHALPWNELVADPVGPIPCKDDPLAFTLDHFQQMEETIDRYGLADFEPSIAWLRKREAQGAAASPALIHNDFHPQNILLRSGEMVVIDWSFAEVGDYRMDLAWSAMLLGVMVGDEYRAGMLKAYERSTGQPIENLEYFEALKFTMRMLTIATWLDDSVDIPVAGITKQAIRGDYKVHALNPYRRLKEITGLEIRTIEEL